MYKSMGGWLSQTKIQITLIVGGGIRTPEIMREVAAAGPDWIVIGTMIESCTSLEEVTEEIQRMTEVLQSSSL